jgi:hypothetical protein
LFGLDDLLTLNSAGFGTVKSALFPLDVELPDLYSKSGSSSQGVTAWSIFGVGAVLLGAEFSCGLCSIEVHKFNSAVAAIPAFIPTAFKIGGAMDPLQLYQLLRHAIAKYLHWRINA